ncbi:S41 family peptidase [Paenibacillus sp. CF384]|uniref:S41 family peptidase n=1 Tax=Paenibacillus sp. CF384 TaxID=1884382 RepID=UPI0015A54BE0|nr:S41 family peptidase [Paenibacillus sp. CF384]
MSFKLAEDKPTLNEELRKQELAFDNYGFYKVERLQGNIGYLDLHALAPPELAGETAVSAMNFLANTSGMIIDLRQCGGWSPYMVTFLSSYLLSETPVHLNDFYWRYADVTQSFWSTPYVSGKRFGPHKPVFVLTSKQTFSASEEFAYDLQAIERATVVGEITGGGAHPGEVHRLNHYFEVFIPKGRAINPVTKSNWEGTGVIPDIEVSQEQAFDIAYDRILEIVREREKAAH